jgi:serine/threonine protein kinase
VPAGALDEGRPRRQHLGLAGAKRLAHTFTGERARVSMIAVRGHTLREKIEETTDFSTYRACREADGVPVMLKVLRTEGSTRTEVARFKHQYERIARVASPRLVGVRGVEELAGAVAIVLEDFPGRDLARLLAERPSCRMSVGEALDLAVALAEGLAALHGAGLVHRDLRPHNVLVGMHGAVKLNGFGVDAEITRAHERLYAPAVIADVLPYVSPEQTGRMNRGVDYRTDFYALGVILYQTLTGQRPFEAPDPMELIHAHLALAPAPPSRVDPTIPAAVSGVVLKLLAKNAEQRYQSAEGLVADLERCREALRATGTIEPFVAGQRDRQDLFQIHQKLYGREHDIAALTAAFERALAGGRELVLVSGYSGIGKSSLVHEILKPLARQKGYFTSGKYDQYNRDTPYSAVIQAFDGLVRQILTESEARILRWRSAILEALGPNAQVVCDVVPSLSHVIGAQPPVPALGPLEAQNRLSRCFLRFVSVFARAAHPLVLFLDDLQWVDPASLGLLRALLDDDSLEALFFCGAFRDNEVSPGHPFVRAIGELEHAGLVVCDIVLAPLARPHLLEMLSDSLGRDDCGPLVDAVRKKAGGNPFFVKQFVRSLHDHGVLGYTAGSGWRWDLAAIDALAGRAARAQPSLLVLEPQQLRHHGREGPREHAPPRAVEARDLRLHQLRGVPLRPWRHRARLSLRPRCHRPGRAPPGQEFRGDAPERVGRLRAALERGLPRLQGVAARGDARRARDGPVHLVVLRHRQRHHE